MYTPREMDAMIEGGANSTIPPSPFGPPSYPHPTLPGGGRPELEEKKEDEAPRAARLNSNPDPDPNPNPEGKCAYYLSEKGRFCKRGPVKGGAFCSVHA